MKNFHAIALAAASAALLSVGCGAAVAQTVSDGDSYQQGYAAGASAKERNSFSAFDSGYKAGQVQNNMESATNSALAFDRGYQAGVAASTAQVNRDQQQAFNEGYTARGIQDRSIAARAFDNGYEAGVTRRAPDDLDFP